MPYKKSNKSIQDSAFKLRSGNTTPFKQMGSSPLTQKNPYKGWHPQDIAVDKLMTRTDLSKVQFEKELAKITKTVDPYPNVKSTTAPKAPKSSAPKNFNMTGSSKAGKFIKWAKKAGRFFGGKALGVAGMLSSTLSHADQPTEDQGKVKYPGGKIDFTK